MKKKMQKLQLRKVTLRNLNNNEQADLKGGAAITGAPCTGTAVNVCSAIDLCPTRICSRRDTCLACL
jgi:hypothetical protein